MRPLGEAADHVMCVVRGMGFDPSESSRLAQMRNILNKGFNKETDPNFEQACEALRDITLIDFAFDRLGHTVPPNVLRKKVQILVKDSCLPQDDPPETPGRDTQSELHVAATCQAAGILISLDEPDVIVEVNGTQYGLAVKRLKSLRQLRRRFCAAVDQIERSGRPGFVVLDMVLAANPENENLGFVVTDEGFCHIQSSRFDPFIKNNLQKFREWRAGREVRGVLVLDHLVGPVDAERKYGLRSWTEFTDLDPHNQRRRKEAMQFFREYQKGLPNLMK